MHIKDIKNKLKVLKKRAQGSVGTAIKVLTATVLGASILVGGYALTNEVVLPNTTEKVESMFAYSADANGNAGGSGTVEPTPNAPETITFTLKCEGYNDVTGEMVAPVVCQYTVEAGTTWEEFINTNNEWPFDGVEGLDGKGILCLAPTDDWMWNDNDYSWYPAGAVCTNTNGVHNVNDEYITDNAIMGTDPIEAGEYYAPNWA